MKIDFTIEGRPDPRAEGAVLPPFTDALDLRDNHGLSEAEIEAMQEARFKAWAAVVTAPPSDPVEDVFEEVSG